MNHLGIMLKWRFWFKSIIGGVWESAFPPSFRWCLCYWSLVFKDDVWVAWLEKKNHFRAFSTYSYSNVVYSLSHVRFFCDPMNCSPPSPLSMGFPRQEYLKWVVISFSRRSSQPRDQIHVSFIGRWILSHWATREAHSNIKQVLFYLTCKNNHKYFPIHAEMQPLPPVLALGWPCD